MPNKIKIELLSKPAPFEGMSFGTFLIGDDQTKTIFKRFVSGYPANGSQVPLAVNLEETIVTLYHNLLDNDADDMVTFTLEEGIIYMVFSQLGNYGFTKNTILREANYSLEIAIFEQEIIPSISDFPYETLSILIIDTYDNDRPLIEEFTQINSPKLKWDSGDDLYGTFMTSVLTFNILTTDKVDAKFKHLFTGDENRYKVKLFFVNNEEVAALCWQGYLLPDQFKEPYKNGVNFIEFTATDMIGALKGKYLEPWYYVNRLPIAELIATILKMTGLDQELLVKPSIVPAIKFKNWKDINVNLVPYFDGKKYTDVYQILEDVLQAQALTLYSYRGFWWLDGVTRKKDTSGSVLNFSSDGIQLPVIRLFSKKVNTAFFEANLPVFTGVTPWKSVEVNFNPKAADNVFDDSVVKKDIFLTTYTDNLETAPLTGNAYRDSIFKDWTKVGCPELIYRTESRRKFSESLNFTKNVSSFFLHNIDVNYTLVNYFECPEKPYLLSGIEYELEFEGLFIYRSVYLVNGVSERLQAGKFDSLFRFQMLVNDSSVLTNVPELSDMNRYVYERSNEFINDDDRLTFKVKAKFKLNEGGPLTFRILHPKVENSTDFSYLAVPQVWQWNVLKITAVDEIENDKVLSAQRNINFTQIYDAELNISCSEDVAVENSFGIGFPINQPPYLYYVPKDHNPAVYNDNQYFPTGIASLQLQTFDSTTPLKQELFTNDFRKAVYRQTPSGEKTLFGDLWVRTINAAIRMGYLLSYTGSPLLPKPFYEIKELDPDDELWYMQVKYATEVYANRAYWRLAGGLFSFSYKSYAKIFADAIHSVQPETLYRLEGGVMDLVFPDQLIGFYFDNENRQFIPTTIELDLTAGKTQIVATEKKFEIPNDITYE